MNSPMPPATAEPVEPLLKVEQVAELLGLSPKTIYNLVNSGELPHVRMGRSIRFAPSALRAITGA